MAIGEAAGGKGDDESGLRPRFGRKAGQRLLRRLDEKNVMELARRRRGSRCQRCKADLSDRRAGPATISFGLPSAATGDRETARDCLQRLHADAGRSDRALPDDGEIDFHARDSGKNERRVRAAEAEVHAHDVGKVATGLVRFHQRGRDFRESDVCRLSCGGRFPVRSASNGEERLDGTGRAERVADGRLGRADRASGRAPPRKCS